jgi:hypothetical protein
MNTRFYADMAKLLRSLKRGDCWCGMPAEHPVLAPPHTRPCLEAAFVLAELESRIRASKADHHGAKPC